MQLDDIVCHIYRNIEFNFFMSFLKFLLELLFHTFLVGSLFCVVIDRKMLNGLNLLHKITRKRIKNKRKLVASCQSPFYFSTLLSSLSQHDWLLLICHTGQFLCKNLIRDSVALLIIADQFPISYLIRGFCCCRLRFLELLDLLVHMLSKEHRRNISETVHVIVCLFLIPCS